jgi:hypothetical protein
MPAAHGGAKGGHGVEVIISVIVFNNGNKHNTIKNQKASTINL